MGVFGPANNPQGVLITASAYLWLARDSMTVPQPPSESNVTKLLHKYYKKMFSHVTYGVCTCALKIWVYKKKIPSLQEPGWVNR